jgi:NADPH-dependent FMN reductase
MDGGQRRACLRSPPKALVRANCSRPEVDRRRLLLLSLPLIVGDVVMLSALELSGTRATRAPRGGRAEDIARKSHYKFDQVAPIAKVDDLTAYDAIIIGAGTRFGRMPSQMGNFLDQAGGLWARGALHGKVGGAFTSSATQHGGQETTLFSIITNLLMARDVPPRTSSREPATRAARLRRPQTNCTGDQRGGPTGVSEANMLAGEPG